MVNSQRVTFDQALKDIRDRTFNPEDGSVRTTERGKAFERLMIHYFRNDSIFRDEFVEVKGWDEWYNEPDTGIDIVAEDRRGELVGIQCKCDADDDRLDLKDFSTMFTIQDREKVNRLMLVYTGEGLTSHAQKYCDDYHVHILTQSDLRKSPIDWSTRHNLEPKKLRPHQVEAVERTVQGLQNADRGKLIMACGTGKTLTALHIAERIGGLVLYLVPSLSLIPQTMREWADNKSIPHRYLAVCSDKSAAKDEQGSITEIPIKPSTNVDDIIDELGRLDGDDAMCVIFSTYNSVGRVGKAIQQSGHTFDLILFDEAHRTTGAEGIKESYYLAAHSDENVPAKRRLYMTATPRVYAWKGKVTAQEKGLDVYSMDDVTKYGDTLYSLQFSEAVEKKLLTPFKVVMREVDQGDTYGEIVKAAREQGEDIADYGDIDLGYLTKIGGILKAITYPDGNDKPPRPLQRVMVFHSTIKKSKLFAGDGLKGKTKKPLKLDETTQKFHWFDHITERLLSKAGFGYRTVTKHVDGATNSKSRGIRIDWLRASAQEPNEIRLLSNARCLQEGVDVPALDAVVFMEPKKSPIDIIQSIGRVMRTTPDKELGYVIIPIPVLKGDDPSYALHKNRRYEQINHIMRAILAHDDSLRRLLNEYALRQSKTGSHTEPPDLQEIPPGLMDWLAKNLSGGVSNELLSEIRTVMLSLGDGSYHANIGERLGEQAVVIQNILEHQIEADSSISDVINEVHDELQNVVGSTLTIQQTVKALAQHAVMTRVFQTLFPGNHNPVATAFDNVLDRLNIQGQMKEFETFYLGLEADFEHFKEPGSKQDFVRAIYDAFFRGADKKAATKHGIVHTPVEVVDFILDSIQYTLQSEFGKSLDDRRVKILDPFTGTGIFLAQLLERGMISPGVIREKYLHDIYANEVMLPAFYVAMSNIETAYQKVSGEYLPFEGISYMDTFDQHPSYRLESRYRERQTSLVDTNLQEASERVRYQGMEDINVIVGNPPYSAGQKSANDDNQNIRHP
ncbi:MAG: hypothetical protein F4088_07675, partial [Chloroflexi bacterium]|nr:hypothetical protein [Chloroflexota bacterium]